MLWNVDLSCRFPLGVTGDIGASLNCHQKFLKAAFHLQLLLLVDPFRLSYWLFLLTSVFSWKGLLISFPAFFNPGLLLNIFWQGGESFWPVPTMSIDLSTNHFLCNSIRNLESRELGICIGAIPKTPCSMYLCLAQLQCCLWDQVPLWPFPDLDILGTE